MRARGSRRIVVAAAALIGCALLCAPAVSAEPRAGLTLATASLRTETGHRIELASLSGRRSLVQLSVSQGRLTTGYSVYGGDGAGIHGRFGSLGRAALNFHLRHRRTVKQDGCTMVEESGVFRGTLSFHGEGGYAEAETHALDGSVLRLPNGLCFPDDRAKREGLPSFLRITNLTAAVRTAVGKVSFNALTGGPFEEEPLFSASLSEQHGAMKVVRSALVPGGEESLSIDPGARPRNASVAPPAPFVGTAVYSKPDSQPATWTGTLSISLLGASEPTVLAGAGFRSRICAKIEFTSTCDLGGGGDSYGSGSQSQAFWDARLSWSR